MAPESMFLWLHDPVVHPAREPSVMKEYGSATRQGHTAPDMVFIRSMTQMLWVSRNTRKQNRLYSVI